MRLTQRTARVVKLAYEIRSHDFIIELQLVGPIKVLENEVAKLSGTNVAIGKMVLFQEEEVGTWGRVINPNLGDRTKIS